MRIPRGGNRFWKPPAAAAGRAVAALTLAFSTLGTGILPGCMFETESKGPVILFMGNSITLHAPAPELGWNGNWGMAASAPENDYVHRTVALLDEKGMEADARIADRNCVPCDGGIDEQAHNMEQVRKLRPRYVVVQLSEHSFDIELRSGKMLAQYRSLLQALSDAGVPHVYCLGAWGEKSPDDARGTAIRAALSGFPGYEFLDISPVVRDTSSYGDPAAFTDANVIWHPGDRGMLGIAGIVAEAVWADR